MESSFPVEAVVNKVTHLLNTGSRVIVSWVGETCTDWDRRVYVREIGFDPVEMVMQLLYFALWVFFVSREYLCLERCLVINCLGGSAGLESGHENILLHTFFLFHLVNEVTNTSSRVIIATYSPPDNTLRPTGITGLHPVFSLGKGSER